MIKRTGRVCGLWERTIRVIPPRKAMLWRELRLNLGQLHVWSEQVIGRIYMIEVDHELSQLSIRPSVWLAFGLER